MVNYNGKLIESGIPLFNVDNRSFRYGDGLFESLRMFNGQIPLLDHHTQRMRKGLELLKFNIPDYFSPDFFEIQIKKLTGQNLNARIRLTVFRKDGGHFLPYNNSPDFIIEASFLTKPIFVLNEHGIKAGTAENPFTPTYLSKIKTNNSLPYILGKIEASNKGLDDLILYNEKGRIIEATSSNIFVLKNGTLYTPPLSEGCLSGVMRHFIIQNSTNLKFRIKEIPIPLNDFLKAEEIWLTNAIKGIQWVAEIGEYNFNNLNAKEALSSLNKLIKEFNR